MSRRSNWFYPTAFSAWGAEEAEAFERVAKSGWHTYGPEVEGFEREFAAYHSMKYAVMVNSGSSANLLAVAALCNRTDNPITRGDKVVVPALAWSTTYSPLVQYGLELLLADCDDSWCAEAKWRPEWDGARLIVGCSILGNPADLHRWRWMAERRGILFVEDNAESLGASVEGKLCGTFGLMNTFSFFASHQISAIEGGMVLTDDEELYRLCRMLRSHGWTRDTHSPEKFEEEYDFRFFGYNIRPTELHAAVGREQLKKLSHFRDQRQRGLDHFTEAARDLPVKFQQRRGMQSPFGVAFTVESKRARENLATALRANDIDCRLPTGGSFTKHFYGKPWGNQHTPNADRIHDTGMFLGLSPYDISDKIERAVEIMRETLT